jgi:localization factor PodJL
MASGQPWSVKGIDPKAREAAKDLARRSGMTLGEWLNQVILEDEAPEDRPPPAAALTQPTASAPVQAAPAAPVRAAPAKPVYRRAELPVHSQDEIARLGDALDELASRIEIAENRTAEMVGGVDQTVAALVARLDGSEHERAVIAARFEGLAEDIHADHVRLSDRLERAEHGDEPGTAEALRTLEATVSKVASHLYETEAQTRDALISLRGDLDGVSVRVHQSPEDNAALIETMVARIAERLDQAEARTTHAIQGLEASFGNLESRLGAAESVLAEQARGPGLERIAAQLSADVDAVRSEMAEKIQSAADGRLDLVERALEEISGHVKVAERRSTDALEKMGHEVLRLAEAFGRRVQDVERRAANAIEQVGGDVARIADTMEARLSQTDAASAEALEKLGGEIARITERLADRIGNAERRSAQAIDDVGDQVARVTARLQERQERTATDLADRIRQSEERTARLLEETRLRVEPRPFQAPAVEAPYRAAEVAAAPEPHASGSESLDPFAHPRDEAEQTVWAEAEPAHHAAPEPDDAGPDYVEPEPARFGFGEPRFETPEPRNAAFEEAGPEAAESAFTPNAFTQGALEGPEAREEDLIEPVPMNFVTQRFGEPGPLSFRTHEFDALKPKPEIEDPFLVEPFESEADRAEAERLDGAEHHAHEAAEDEAFEDEALEHEAFSPAAFASRGSGLDRFEPEAARAHGAFDEPEEAFGGEPFEEAFEEAHERAEAARDFSGPALLEPLEAEPAYGEFEPSSHAGERPFEADLEEPLPFGQAAAEDPAASHRAMSTRELIEQARAAARAAALAADPKARKAAARAEASGGGFGGLNLNLAKKSKRRGPSTMGAALMVSGTAAVLGMGAAGYVLMSGHSSGVLSPRVMAALGLQAPHAAPHPARTAPSEASADPMAAVALSPQPSDTADASAAPAPAANAGDTGAELYGDAVRRIEARDFSGLDGLRKAANLGYAPAEFYLAKLYETGEAGLKKDLGEARRWTERAAEAGDKKAMHNLALYYVEGSGGPKNTTTAAQWFRRAADLGLVDSQYNLGRLYEEGFGVTQNPAEAYKWYLIAAHAGDAESRASAQRLKGQLSAEAQAAAERSAGAFQAQNSQPPTSQMAQATATGDVAGASIAQRALSRLGYYQGPTDGSPSPALRLAIQAYQRDQGLPATGVPDTALSQRLAVIAQ